jgi:peptide/nickel transport system permease protein
MSEHAVMPGGFDEGALPSSRPRARRRWTAQRVGAVLAAALAALALLGPVVAPHDPEAIEPRQVLAGPEPSHPLGSDSQGRDVLSRLLYAVRVSLGVAIGAVALALVIGGTLGLLAGYYKGWVDTATMRPVDMMLAFPAMLLAITLIAIVGPGTFVVALAIAGIYVPIMARVVRSSTLTVASALYVDAARAHGASSARIIRQHIIPNAIGPALAQAAILAGFAIQIEAALAFLGLGAQPPTPSLGGMLADGRDFLQQAPRLVIVPGAAIAISVLAFLLLGDALRGRIDPRTRGA